MLPLLPLLPLWWWPFDPKPAPKAGDIEFSKCSINSVFECGYLYAPLDYTNTSDERLAKIALVRYPAGGGKTNRNEVLGSVILNPGGPGGSGVDFLMREGLANETDFELNSKYDLVSFDPRGVGKTQPKVSCFGGVNNSLNFETIMNSYGLPGQHGPVVENHEIGHLLGKLELLADVCGLGEDVEMFRYLSTPFVARDIHLLHLKLGDERLNYWGFSYGSVIGTTYAAMFPNDINRMILDGVVDAFNYYQGLWSNNMVNIEQEFDGFFTECEKSTNCTLNKLGNNLKEIVMEYANNLKNHPVAVAGANPPQMLTFADLMGKMFNSMYSPKKWPQLANALYESIKNNNHSLLFDTESLKLTKGYSSEALYAVSCSDNLNEPKTKSEKWGLRDFQNFWDESLKMSPNFSIYFADFGAMCQSFWPYRGAERLNVTLGGNTSFPILFLGNEFDPVTPGEYAEKMASKYTNAVSVLREGYGHCSSSQKSKCIDDIVFKYFVKGEMPERGTFCKVNGGVYEQEFGVKSGWW